MQNLKVEWDQDGRRVRSVVSYSETAAATRKTDLVAEGRTGVEIIETPAFGKRGASEGTAQH
ncbi:hypothetical protein OG243_13670 [Streptomyces sp. NBC_01318]|uniref:hypothetical protein n=1 Tax=Streptomyces sp. NBC_01318 TaxID=2903823 RepID=UPI002E1627D0|nr:hypothetical protein OG243_13670 [Streptomyces sp. NBC_01318]